LKQLQIIKCVHIQRENAFCSSRSLDRFKSSLVDRQADGNNPVLPDMIGTKLYDGEDATLYIYVL
jgi:hypothetical protein